MPHVPELIRTCISVEHCSRINTIDWKHSLKCWNHLLNSFLEICFGKLEQLCESFYFFIEESIRSLLTKFDDGFCFPVMKGLGVLRLEHVKDGRKERGERKSLNSFNFFSIIEELIDGLDSSFLHFLLVVDRSRLIF